MKLYLTYDKGDSDAKFTIYGDKSDLMDLLSIVQRNRVCSNVGLVQEDKKKASDEPF